ncbi:hypothetical protein BL250_16710 [Erwinia sp. OLTSP20]|nr:hypothetical protein BV501_14785 [Erwinia sp. OAMSP11]PIJ74629.1 hypothetical protein BK416_03990 [Erwinia sp. OLSSP12]PIJ79660.1 hypothetical protein BLD47_13410 [Erwinia sp. OLCASP19]PIJ80445.1 hypothetical protein BLD46_15255 [Erwinia sp. OLMTSP26]PIJ82560.1 hypothetical protein BLD49_15150 [Erwinia sp. OLMDSP33]PIJ88861.1 hypothetical protein BL250_16710 [Erwinia sp. OLTSP20]PIJ91463.1 hypothetical protein BL249_08955 [Erwinia sp. OLFS4]
MTLRLPGQRHKRNGQAVFISQLWRHIASLMQATGEGDHRRETRGLSLSSRRLPVQAQGAPGNKLLANNKTTGR